MRTFISNRTDSQSKVYIFKSDKDLIEFALKQYADGWLSEEASVEEAVAHIEKAYFWGKWAE